MRIFTISGLFVFLFFICLNTAYAQFEQKLTINGSGAAVIPDITNEYVSYSVGIGAEGGLQYNINRHVSALGNVRFFRHFGTDEFPDAFFQNIGLGIGLKFNFIPSGLINPYVFAEANLNVLWEEDWRDLEEPYWDPINEVDVFYYHDEDSGFGIGGLGGAGLDFRLNDNLSLFIQAGSYYIYWNESLNIYGQGGVRINLLKSKTI